MMQQIAETFRGGQRALSILIWFDSFVLFAVAVLCAWRFFQVDTARMQILYATCFLFFMIAVMAVFGLASATQKRARVCPTR